MLQFILGTNGDKVLTHQYWDPNAPDIALMSKKEIWQFGWEKIPLNNGWMKLRHDKTGFFLTLDASDRNIYFHLNVKPCQGQKPCLR